MPNLNKLVQPECGAPNPLVAAARQIATGPTHRFQTGPPPPAGLVQQQRQLSQQQLNFAKEFAQREPPPLVVGHSSATTSTTTFHQELPQQASSSTSSRLHHQHHHQHHHPHHHHPQLNMINHHMPQTTGHFGVHHQQQHQQQPQHQTVAVAGSSSSISAGDQLETKYRNDMISASQQSASTKLDDVEFWQTISQAYMGPPTFNNIAKLSAAQAANLGAAARAAEEHKIKPKRRKQTAMPSKPFSLAMERGRLERAQAALERAKIRAAREGKTAGPALARAQEELHDAEAYYQRALVRAEEAKMAQLDGAQIDEREEEEEAEEEAAAAAETAKLIESMQLDDMEYAFDERNPLKGQYENPFEEGLKRLEQGDIPSAALLFEAAVQREPENALAWRYLGTTQAQNEMDKSAIRALRNCLRLDPTDQEARLAIAVSLVNETQHREACRHLLEWLTKHERYGTIEASLEQFERLDAELASAPDPFLMNPLALLDKHHEYVRARFVEAARMAPNNPDPEVQNALGVLFNMRGDYTKAVDCFKAALSVRQQDSLLWNRLGATLANGNKSDEAVIAYRRALEISPGFLRSRYNLAISLIHLNLYDEAAKQLIQILNTQAAGQGGAGGQVRTRSITSTSIWNTLRTVATLMNKPDLYPTIDGRDLGKCNELIMRTSS